MALTMAIFNIYAMESCLKMVLYTCPRAKFIIFNWFGEPTIFNYDLISCCHRCQNLMWNLHFWNFQLCLVLSLSKEIALFNFTGCVSQHIQKCQSWNLHIWDFQLCFVYSHHMKLWQISLLEMRVHTTCEIELTNFLT